MLRTIYPDAYQSLRVTPEGRGLQAAIVCLEATKAALEDAVALAAPILARLAATDPDAQKAWERIEFLRGV